MLIAVACKGLDVADCLDSAECITCYLAERGIIQGCRTTPLPRASFEEQLSFMKAIGVDALICGSVERTALNRLVAEGIDVVQRVTGNPADAASSYVLEAMSCPDDELMDEEE